MVILGKIGLSSVHTGNRKKNIGLGKGPTDGLDDTAITLETKYPVHITKYAKKTCLSLQ